MKYITNKAESFFTKGLHKKDERLRNLPQIEDDIL